MITFCPAFFTQHTYLNNLDNQGTNWTPYDLYKLVSYEHILVHEFMHVAQFGYNIPSTVILEGIRIHANIKLSVDDLDSTELSGSNGQALSVYGATRCHEFAWLYKYNSPSSINFRVANNGTSSFVVSFNRLFANVLH